MMAAIVYHHSKEAQVICSTLHRWGRDGVIVMASSGELLEMAWAQKSEALASTAFDLIKESKHVPSQLVPFLEQLFHDKVSATMPSSSSPLLVSLLVLFHRGHLLYRLIL